MLVWRMGSNENRENVYFSYGALSMCVVVWGKVIAYFLGPIGSYNSYAEIWPVESMGRDLTTSVNSILCIRNGAETS